MSEQQYSDELQDEDEERACPCGRSHVWTGPPTPGRATWDDDVPLFQRYRPVSPFAPTPPCPDCGARMVWDVVWVTLVPADEERDMPEIRAKREVDASPHAEECPQLRLNGAERAVLIRQGARA